MMSALSYSSYNNQWILTLKLSIDKVMITDPIVLISVVSNPFCADFVWSGVGYFYVPLLRYLLGVPHPF